MHSVPLPFLAEGTAIIRATEKESGVSGVEVVNADGSARTRLTFDQTVESLTRPGLRTNEPGLFIKEPGFDFLGCQQSFCRESA